MHQSVKRCRMDGVRLLVSRGHTLCYVRDHDFPKCLAFADSQLFDGREVGSVVDAIAAHFLVQCIVLDRVGTSCVGL